MNVFNRVVVVVLLLALLAGIVYTAVMPAQAVQYTQNGLTSVDTFFNNAARTSGWLFAGGRILAGFAAVLLICWLLWKELKPRWQPYGKAGDTLFFKQNAVRLAARIAAAPAQGGQDTHRGRQQCDRHYRIRVQTAGLAHRPIGRRHHGDAGGDHCREIGQRTG